MINKKKLEEQNKVLSNLYNLECEINRFAPALMTVFQNVEKIWDGCHHLQITTKNNNKKFLVRCTTHFEYNNLSTKYENKGADNWMLIEDNKLKIHFSENVKCNILLYDNHFYLDGVKKEYSLDDSQKIIRTNTKTKKEYVYRDNLTVLKMKSLVKLCGKANGHLGGKAKAYKQTGYQKVIIGFDHAFGYKEEEKTIKDAWNIVKKFYNKSEKSLRRALKKGEVKVDCGDYSVFINLLLGTICPSTLIVNYKDENLIDENLKNSGTIKVQGQKSLDKSQQYKKRGRPKGSQNKVWSFPMVNAAIKKAHQAAYLNNLSIMLTNIS